MTESYTDEFNNSVVHEKNKLSGVLRQDSKKESN